jgi:hypothetical protein
MSQRQIRLLPERPNQTLAGSMNDPIVHVGDPLAGGQAGKLGVPIYRRGGTLAR